MLLLLKKLKNNAQLNMSHLNYLRSNVVEIGIWSVYLFGFLQTLICLIQFTVLEVKFRELDESIYCDKMMNRER